MDPRTGLGRFRQFTISNYDLMKKLASCCKSMNIEEILDLPDVKERLDLYNEQSGLFREMLEKYSKKDGNVVITDLRGVYPIYVGNRFLIYTLFPEQNISLWVVDGKQNENCVITAGYSILNRTSTVDVGSMLLKYGGGGHKQVGTCQVPYAEADRVFKEIIEQCKS
jgi:nanoRNase/pAp phosphatase (c-di-AMP/oligoRNAs hydrolase)